MRDPLYPRPRRPAWLLPVGIAVGAIAAIAGGALLGVALSGPRDAAQGEATPSVFAAGTPGPSPTLELSTEPTSSPSPTPVALPVIPNRAVAEITADAVVLRSEPNESSLALGELGAGARLFIIGEPGEGDGQRWYRIAYVEGPSSGFDCNISCGPSLGYVATPASGDDSWLEEVDVTCPASPLTTDQLLELLPLERLHCYGRSELSVTGPLDEFANEPSGTSTPEWLADNPPRTSGNGSFGIHFAPDFDGELPDPGTTVRMIGHFEDLAAATCRVDYTLLPDAPSTAHIVLGCRTRLVVTDVDVLAP